ncbi:MAG: hypothetical protein Kow0022_11620 [Phycisphaerales bacterium]
MIRIGARVHNRDDPARIIVVQTRVLAFETATIAGTSGALNIDLRSHSEYALPILT